MDSTWESLDQWRKFFQTSNTDIFSVIQQAIRVAATDYPEEFKSNRDRFAQNLLIFKLRCSSGSGLRKEEEKFIDTNYRDFSKTERVFSGGSSDTNTSDEKERLRMENAKKRMREGYQKAKDARKVRRIQIIDLKDLPRQEENGNRKRHNLLG